jgi:glycosyltransferase involved in cell wall biosynthesis
MHSVDPRGATVLECSGVGAGGITRVLTEVVRHWPAGHRLAVVAAPPVWLPPADVRAEVELVDRQAGGRSRAIASATATLRRVTARPGTGRVLSLSPSVAVAASRLPVTTVVHDLAFRLWPRGLSRGQLRYRAISYATAVARSARLLCVSARTRHDLYGLYGVPAHRSRVWRPGSDLAAAPGELPAALAGRGRYLAVAGHAPHKGVELAVEAVAALPGYALAVLTGGNPLPEHAAAAARAGVADRIVFLDRLSEPAYAATVAGAAAFLMPSHFEGYGLPAAEALRLGVPTVVSPDPALAEATGGAAVRMATWSAQALVEAVAAARAGGRPPAAPAGRTWREAVEELHALVTDARPERVGGRCG